LEALLRGARTALAPWRNGDGEVAFALPAHILTARKS
jgi:hypothetical protein